MNADCLKLTVYFGESDRVGHELLSDALLGVFGRAGLQAAVLLRALEGFGPGHGLGTQRLLTLSEDLPLVAIAVDRRERIEAVVPEVSGLVGAGLVTLERARLLQDEPRGVELHEPTKLTIYLGRDERIGGRPAFLAVVDHLRARGLAGATVLLGVDGMAHGRRRRARFFSRNATVPLMVVAVGPGPAVSAALDGLGALLAEPLLTLERVRVCKRDGELLAEPERELGAGLWQKLTIYASEQARHAEHPLYVQLVRRLRAEGASGATALRGVWGFSGDHAPHGDRLFAVRRRVPVVTTVVDAPDRLQRWFRIVDELTDEAGLVTSEIVPVARHGS